MLPPKKVLVLFQPFIAISDGITVSQDAVSDEYVNSKVHWDEQLFRDISIASDLMTRKG